MKTISMIDQLVVKFNGSNVRINKTQLGDFAKDVTVGSFVSDGNITGNIINELKSGSDQYKLSFKSLSSKTNDIMSIVTYPPQDCIQKTVYVSSKYNNVTNTTTVLVNEFNVKL